MKQYGTLLRSMTVVLGLLGVAASLARADPEWDMRYNGSANGKDRGLAAVTDHAGNVYVTGASWGGDLAHGGTDYDIVTIKYDADGTQKWLRRYNGRGNGTDSPIAIRIDGAGNLYVVGNSQGDTSSSDYITLKYRSSDGKLLWGQRFNGYANNDDFATACALDSQDNILITGYSAGAVTFEYTTVKYSPTGKQLWTRRYVGPNSAGGGNYPAAITTDSENNVLVTGSSWNGDPLSGGTGDDFLTIKYSPEGKLLWKARYNGTGNDYDNPSAMAVDSKGYVYVTGGSYRGKASKGGSETDIVTIKYSGATGGLIWQRAYNGSKNGDDYPSALTIDSTRHIYVTGSVWNGNATKGGKGYDLALIKYDRDGRKLWDRTYNGTMDGDDAGTALTLDSQGNACVAGRTYGGKTSAGGTDNDIIVLKFSPSGEELWEKTYNGSADGTDYPAAITLDALDTIFVVGTSYGGDPKQNGTDLDYITLKLLP